MTQPSDCDICKYVVAQANRNGLVDIFFCTNCGHANPTTVSAGPWVNPDDPQQRWCTDCVYNDDNRVHENESLLEEARRYVD